MPCYNGGPFVREAIESVLKQTYRTFELIIVNDGSTDESDKIVRSIEDSRIIYIKQDNLGQCAACNNGFKKSSGSLIKFFDADDILSEKVLEKQVSVVDKNESCIAYMHWQRFYNNDVSRKDPGPTQIKVDCLPMDYITWQRNTPMLQCGIWLFPRQLIEANGLWDERLSLINDTEFITRTILNAKELKYADQCELLYRTNSNSGTLSQTLSQKSLDSALLSIDLMAGYLFQKENSERVKILVAQSYQMLREWAFPKHKSFTKLVEKRLDKYAEIKIHYRGSGAIFNIILKMFGWKTARFLQYYYYKMRFPDSSN
jgi:glycosyltransferase involved in cell wall biosynthesis